MTTLRRLAYGTLLAATAAGSVWAGYRLAQELRSFWAALDHVGDYPLTEDQALDHEPVTELHIDTSQLSSITDLHDSIQLCIDQIDAALLRSDKTPPKETVP